MIKNVEDLTKDMFNYNNIIQNNIALRQPARPKSFVQ